MFSANQNQYKKMPSEKNINDMIEELPKVMRKMDVTHKEVEQIAKAFSDAQFQELFQE